MSEDNKALTEQWFEQVWTVGRHDAIDELAHENLVAHGLYLENGEAVVTRDQFKEFHREFCGALSGISIDVEDLVAEGDKVAARCTARGIHSGDNPGDTPVEFTGISIVRFENGQIIEAWNEFDFLRLFKQIRRI